MKIDASVGRRIRLLRQRAGVSLRALAERAGVTPAMVSYVENGKASPSIVTLEKLLGALGTDVAAFFGAEQDASEGPVYERERMRLVSDEERSYTLVFPPGKGIGVEVTDELMQPGRARPDFQVQGFAFAGYVLAGRLTLQIESGKPRTLRPGDAFHLPAGVSHRGFAAGSEPARLITFRLTAAKARARKRKK